jgi:hypothetical protein
MCNEFGDSINVTLILDQVASENEPKFDALMLNQKRKTFPRTKLQKSLTEYLIQRQSTKMCSHANLVHYRYARNPFFFNLWTVL